MGFFRAFNIGRRVRRLCGYSALLWIAWPLIAVAQAPERTAAEWSHDAEQHLKTLGSIVQSWEGTPPDDDAVLAVQTDVAAMRERAEQCVERFSKELNDVDERLAALGEQSETAAADIRTARKQFEKEKQTIETQLAVCRLLLLGARDIKDTLARQRRQQLSRALLDRENDLSQILAQVVREGITQRPKLTMAFDPWPAIGIVVLLLALQVPAAMTVSAALRRHAKRFDDTSEQRTAVLAGMYARRIPWLAATLAIVVGLYTAGSLPLAGLGAALILTMLVAPLVHVFVCQGLQHCAESLPARLLLALVLAAGALILTKIDSYVPRVVYDLIGAAALLAIALLGLWLLFRLSQRDGLQTLRQLRLPIAIALLAGPIADWLGYRNLGAFLTLGIYGSGAGILLAWLLLGAIGSAVAQLRDANNEKQPQLRRLLGYAKGERVAGLSAMHWLFRIATLVGLGYILLFSWQISAADTASVREFFSDGFELGAARIVPSKLLLAAFAFFVLLTIARWLRRQLGERWLTKTKLDPGARQSIVSLSSYAIIGLATMLALGMAGLDFQNLAIIAGALSVGIGFGLQNIVNNFVSGLILLFERPVRPGDWVVVGGTEGHVRRISIRYTLIQTFDRADVLVPNSELISNQVTNLMLSDNFGRVNVPVGVAYGTDTRKVKEILEKIVREHPMVALHDPRVVPPRVLFMGFGDSSLDFEVRFFIHNVDYKLSVRSDILFAIDDAFRKEGIEIPFPQRVIHKADPADPDAPPNGEDST